MTPTERPHRVVALIVPGMSALEIAVASEVFGIDRQVTDRPWYRFRLCTPEPGPVQLDGGLTLLVDHDLGALSRADTVVIPGWGARDEAVSHEVVTALRRAARRGARLLSFCTGAFPIAATGLLDGRRATTHWMAADAFEARHPAVDLECGVLYVHDGPIWTGAGSAASIDCALAVVREDHGSEVANAIARDLVVPPHRDGGQAQFVAAPVPPPGDETDLAATLDWAVAQLDQPLTVADLADHAHLGTRQFTRRFRDATGTTPLQWLLAQRILLARRLLETTDRAVELVATDAGFGSPAALRLHFHRALRTSPQAYRRTFRSAA